MLRRRAVLRSRGAGLLLFVVLASCQKTEDQKGNSAASPRVMTAGLIALPSYLEDLATATDPTAFANYVKSVEETTPRQNTHQVKIKKYTGCNQAKGTFDFSTYATAGSYSFDDLTTNNPGYGYAFAVVNNESTCVPIGLPLPAQTATDPGTAIFFIAAVKPAQPSDPKAFKIFIVDSATRQIVASYGFKPCEPGAKHPWYGDHTLPRKTANNEVCDHGDPNKMLTAATTAPKNAKASTPASPSTLASVTGGDLNDPWTLWISCGADCCYADPGGTKDSTDTTKKDSTKKGGSPPSAAATRGMPRLTVAANE